MNPATPLSRRAFVGAASLGPLALLAACTDATAPDTREPEARLLSRRHEPFQRPTYGTTDLELENFYTGRNGKLHIPSTYHAAVEAPLIIALHGAGSSGEAWTTGSAWLDLLEEFKAVMVAPDSRSFATWDLLEQGAYSDDVKFIDAALREVYRKVYVDTSRVIVLGFSDGASEALGLGLMNGDLFNCVVAFSPGVMHAPFARGHTRAFISHGTSDTVLPYATSHDLIMPTIKSYGVPVEFSTFAGGHTIPVSVARAALTYALAAQ